MKVWRSFSFIGGVVEALLCVTLLSPAFCQGPPNSNTLQQEAPKQDPPQQQGANAPVPGVSPPVEPPKNPNAPPAGRGASNSPAPTGSFKFDTDVVTLPQAGLITLRLLYSKDTDLPPDVTLKVFQFVDNANGSIPVVIARGECSQSLQDYAADLKITNPEPIETLCLKAPPIPLDAKFNGSIAILSAKSASNAVKLTIIPPVVTPAVMVLSGSQADLIKVSVPPWGRGDSAIAAAHLKIWERSKKRPLNGVFVRLDQVTKSPGNFSQANVTLHVNGHDVAPGAANAGSIPPGEGTPVELQFHGLGPGEYTAVFAFDAANLAPEGAQKFTVNLQVSHNAYLPIFVLLMALVLSLFTTRVITAQMRKFRLQQKIRDLSPPWLSAFAQTPLVVWIRATLHQSATLSRRFWLTSPELIEDRLNGVQTAIAALADARKTRDRLQDGLDFLVFRRVALSLERLLSRIDGGTLDPQALAAIHTDLTAFNDWLSDDRMPGLLWKEIRLRVEGLTNEIGSQNVNAPADQLAAQLLTDLKGALATPPDTPLKAIDIYHKFAKLRVLWDNREDAKALQECVNAAQSLERFLNVTDLRQWEHFKTDGAAALTVPKSQDARGYEAFDLLQFEVTAAPAFSSTFLFRHRVQFHWQFTLTPKTRVRKREAIVLEPITLGPSVVQYFPEEGSVKARVELEYEGQKRPLNDAPVIEIKKSQEFNLFKGLRDMEWLQWSIAGAFAMLSGMLLLYIKVPGFGTFGDYINLFLWGVGVDQGKNLAQSFAASTSLPAAPAGGR